MDSQHQSFADNSAAASRLLDTTQSPALSASSQHRSANSDADMEKEEIVSIIKQTAANLHSAASFNASNTIGMVHSSNIPETHMELDKILESHFYSLNLVNPQSVIVFLLLSCFLLKKENKEIETVRKLYENHISLLKEKNSEIEDRTKQSSGTGKSHSESASASLQSCVSCDALKARLEGMAAEESQLQQSYDDVSRF